MNKVWKKIRLAGHAVLVIIILTFVGTGDLYMWAFNRMMMD